MLAALLAAAPAAAQERPAFKAHRFDEDWRPLADPARRTHPLDGLKYMPLPGWPGAFLTIGGELRERGEAVRNPDFGLDLPRDRVLLHRALLHLDLHLGPQVRTFVQFGSFLQTGRLGAPGPTDLDRLDLTQGFADLSVPTGDLGRLTLRGGRQEISFGSSRLVSVRESPNVRRAFDGGRAFWTAGSYRLDAFLVRPVALSPGIFDDRSDTTQGFGGLYLTGPVPAVGALRADLYYFGLRRDDSDFLPGTARETRHTLGTRLFGKAAGWDWDVEGAVQSGSFGRDRIRAWTVASDAGFTFAELPLSPRLGLKADIASGDGNPKDRTLGTFNPLYPKLPYFSEAGLVAPANVMDLQPTVTLQLTPSLTLLLGYNSLWRHRRQDAFYAPPLQPVPGTEGGGSRYIGRQLIADLEWQATENISVKAGYVHATPGDTLRKVGGRTVDFGYGSVAYRF
jgi:hypothetical protein